MRKSISVILLTALLAGCATTKVWHKPGASKDELHAAERDCRQSVLQELRSDSYYRRERASEEFRRTESREVGSTSPALQRIQEAGSIKRRDDMFLDCMQAKGFNRVSPSKSQ